MISAHNWAQEAAKQLWPAIQAWPGGVDLPAVIETALIGFAAQETAALKADLAAHRTMIGKLADYIEEHVVCCDPRGILSDPIVIGALELQTTLEG